jgi:hypothetical protein
VYLVVAGMTSCRVCCWAERAEEGSDRGFGGDVDVLLTDTSIEAGSDLGRGAIGVKWRLDVC